MKAYIQSRGGMPRGMSQYTAWLGFRNMGFETVPFETVGELGPCEREDVVVGGLGVVRARLLSLGVDTSEINYPEELRPFFLKDQKFLYSLLMKTVASSLVTLARDRRYVGATPAILAVLHTWTTRMMYHPHVHLLISAGGVSDDPVADMGIAGGAAAVKLGPPKFGHAIHIINSLLRAETELPEAKPFDFSPFVKF